MTARLFLDLETRSPVPIKNGTYAYAEGARILLFAWAIDDGPVSVWDLTSGDNIPVALADALNDPAVTITAHNASFDRTLMRLAGGPTQRQAARQIERWRCTRARALSHGLPGGLADLCTVLGVPSDAAKDKDGRRLIMLFCVPRKDGTVADAKSHPFDWRRFVAYAGRDIDALRAVDARLPEWNYRGAELALWHLDQRINDRGFAVDRELADAAIAAVDREQQRLAKRTQELTNDEVSSTLRRDLLLSHILVEHGVNLADMRAATVDAVLDGADLSPELRELLTLRQQASKSSTAKYAAVRRACSADGRLRGALQYAGASRTRRWSGRLFQPQNLPRPTMPQADIDCAIDAIKAGCADLVLPDVTSAASNALRGVIVAAPGRKLVVSDLANIEGRCAAWLGGEQWKLGAFAAYDAGTGPDLYCVAYGRAFGVDPASIDKETLDGYLQRQIGKVMELMLQYEGGVGAYVVGAATYDIDLDAMAEAAWPTLPAWASDEAAEFHTWALRQKRSTYGLAPRTFVVCDALKRLWRAAHPGIVATWALLRDSARAAVESPGRTIEAGRFKFRRDGAWLRVLLPSGNPLCYPQPAIVDGALTYAGANQFTRKWGRIGTYGGKLLENACQALARDVLAAAMPAAEVAGYPPILSVHDELITEPADAPEFNAAGLSALMAADLPWAPGLPLAAAGFEALRYRKG
jgi:DNA polymerase